MRRTTAQERAKTVALATSHGQLSHARLARSGFASVQDDFRHFLPVCPFLIGVEQMQRGDEMLLVVPSIPGSKREVADKDATESVAAPGIILPSEKPRHLKRHGGAAVKQQTFIVRTGNFSIAKATARAVAEPPVPISLAGIDAGRRQQGEILGTSHWLPSSNPRK